MDYWRDTESLDDFMDEEGKRRIVDKLIICKKLQGQRRWFSRQAVVQRKSLCFDWKGSMCMDFFDHEWATATVAGLLASDNENEHREA